MSEGLFNFVIGWTFMFAPLLFTDRKRDRYKGSLDVLWGFQMFLTNSKVSLFQISHGITGEIASNSHSTHLNCDLSPTFALISLHLQILGPLFVDLAKKHKKNLVHFP